MLKYQLFKSSRLKFAQLAGFRARGSSREKQAPGYCHQLQQHASNASRRVWWFWIRQWKTISAKSHRCRTLRLFILKRITDLPPLPFFFYRSLGPRSLWYCHFKMAYRHVVKKPQLQARIFLCNWYMKIVRPGREIPENTVQFHVPME